MAKRKPAPVITHTETLCYAIRHLETHVQHWRNAFAGSPDAEENLNGICGRELRQIEALKTMYRFETGTDY